MNKPSDAIIASGRTLDQALVKAAGLLGVTQDQLKYKVAGQRSTLSAFILGRKVEIEAWKSKSRHESRRRPRKKVETEINKVELTSQQVEELEVEIIEFCKGICKAMVGEDVVVESSKEEDGRLILNVKDDFLAEQLNKNYKLAEALEHLLRKKPLHLQQELPFRLFVDFNNVRSDREKELVKMAQDLSIKVSEKQKPVVLNYKSSYDRKIIHMTLDKDERVYTKSIGNGPNRKLMILPVKSNDKSNDQNADT